MSTAAPTVIDIDPADIGDHPHNPRFAVGDVSDLAGSIAEHGVLQPLTVAAREKPKRGETPWVAIMGHRRRAAAVQAEHPTVPCLVRTDLDTTAKQIEVMLEENDHREDLSPVEEAAAYEQLVAFDYSPAEIAKVTGRSVDTVRARLDLMKLSPSLRDKVHDRELTLTDAAAFVEFADVKKDLDRLERAVGTGQVRWVIEDIRRQRDGRARKIKVTADLKAKGVTVVKAPDSWQYSTAAKVRPVSQLAKEDGSDYLKPAKEHADCPGHVAVVSDMGKVEWGCSRPSMHPDRTRTTQADAGNPEAAKFEEDLETASRLRVAYMAERLNAGDLDEQLQKATLLPIVAAQLEQHMGNVDDEEATALCSLLGVDAPTEEASQEEWAAFSAGLVAGLDKAPVPRLIAWLAALRTFSAEFTYPLPTAATTWQFDYRRGPVIEHLDWLQVMGYELSDFERDLVTDEEQAAAS